MKFLQHYSSSKGNLYTLTADNGQRLMIECGVPWRKIMQALDHDITKFAGCLVSHEHKDHCKGIQDVMKAGIDVYVSPRAFELNGRRMKNLDNFRRIGQFYIIPFPLHHDAVDPLGFLIRVDEQVLLYATDTSHITQKFTARPNIIAIECSYDKAVLNLRVANDDINEELAKRLRESHMEKQVCINYLELCNKDKCTEIHLLHMSEDNIDKEAVRKEIEDRFFISTIIKE
jgi:phosphoribosyl 1,2-cyclic phosphodiesterase